LFKKTPDKMISWEYLARDINFFWGEFDDIISWRTIYNTIVASSENMAGNRRLMIE
jgi:hypothetical protein